MNVNEIAQKLRDKLKRYKDFQGLYLYGSHVKGNARPNSDIDIVAVFEEQPKFEKRMLIFEEVLDVELEDDVIIDCHPMTNEELNLNYIFFNEVKKGLYYEAR